MILLRGVQIVHFGSLSADEWDIVIAAEARIHAWRRRCINQLVAQRPSVELRWGESAANVGFSVDEWGGRALDEARWRLGGDRFRRDPFVRQAETYGLAACLLGRGRNCPRCGELLITARRAADLNAIDLLGFPFAVDAYLGALRGSVPGAWHKSTAPARRVGTASGRSPEGMNRSERAWPDSDSDSAPASSTENAQALPPAGRSARAGRHGSAHSPRRPAATGRERSTHFPQLGELLPAEYAQQFELLGGVRAWLRGVENE